LVGFLLKVYFPRKHLDLLGMRKTKTIDILFYQKCEIFQVTGDI